MSDDQKPKTVDVYPDEHWGVVPVIHEEIRPEDWVGKPVMLNGKQVGVVDKVEGGKIHFIVTGPNGVEEDITPPRYGLPLPVVHQDFQFNLKDVKLSAELQKQMDDYNRQIGDYLAKVAMDLGVPKQVLTGSGEMEFKTPLEQQPVTDPEERPKPFGDNDVQPDAVVGGDK